MAPSDAEIIDIRALRCALPLAENPPEDGISTITNTNNEGENRLLKQLDYIQSCVRKDKGLFGKYDYPKFISITSKLKSF